MFETEIDKLITKTKGLFLKNEHVDQQEPVLFARIIKPLANQLIS